MGDKPFDLDAILEEAAAHKKQRLEQARREWESFQNGVETLLMKGEAEHG